MLRAKNFHAQINTYINTYNTYPFLVGGADVKGRGKQAGAGAGAVARGSVLNVQELTSEQKKAHAIEIMKHNCQERLALSWEEFLEKCKQSSAEEKLELYRKIK